MFLTWERVGEGSSGWSSRLEFLFSLTQQTLNGCSAWMAPHRYIMNHSCWDEVGDYEEFFYHAEHVYSLRRWLTKDKQKSSCCLLPNHYQWLTTIWHIYCLIHLYWNEYSWRQQHPALGYLDLSMFRLWMTLEFSSLLPCRREQSLPYHVARSVLECMMFL